MDKHKNFVLATPADSAEYFAAITRAITELYVSMVGARPYLCELAMKAHCAVFCSLSKM